MAIKCPYCLGAKQVLKLGNMIGDCDECEGIGYVAEKTEITQPEKKGLSVKERRQMLKDVNDKWKK